MKVLVKNPDQIAELVDIGTDIEDFRGVIEGYVELHKLNDDLYLMCDEEGRIKDLPTNWVVNLNSLTPTAICGPIILLGRTRYGEFADIPRRHWNYFGEYREG